MAVPTPVLESKIAPAGHIKLKVTNLSPTDNIVLAEFQVARNNTFTTGLQTIENRVAPCEATFAIDATYRRTTHYARVRLTQWVPPVLDTDDLAGTETTGSWSSTLALSSGADQVVDDDIVTVSSTKVKGRYIGSVNGFSGTPVFQPFGETPAGMQADSDLTVALVSGRTYKFSLTAVVGYNAATDLRFTVQYPTVNEIGTYYAGRWKSASYNSASGVATATMVSPVFYHGKATVTDGSGTGGISITEAGSSSTNYFVAYFEFAGRLSPSENGDLALAYGPDVSTTGVKQPWLLHGHLEVEDVTTTGTL